MRLSNDDKNEIFKCYNNKESVNEIINKFKISKATFYRIIKDNKVCDSVFSTFLFYKDSWDIGSYSNSLFEGAFLELTSGPKS